MKVITKLLFSISIAVSTCSRVAIAEDQGFYGGINLGVGKPKINTANGLDKKDSAVGGVLLGYKINKNIGVEAQYTGIGKVTDKVNGSIKGDAASLTTIGLLPLNDEFNLYGKLGIAVSKTTLSTNLTPMNDATRTGVTYGFGGEYNFNKTIGMRIGWDHYNAAVESNVGIKKNFGANVVSVGALYNF